MLSAPIRQSSWLGRRTACAPVRVRIRDGYVLRPTPLHAGTASPCVLKGGRDAATAQAVAAGGLTGHCARCHRLNGELGVDLAKMSKHELLVNVDGRFDFCDGNFRVNDNGLDPWNYGYST